VLGRPSGTFAVVSEDPGDACWMCGVPASVFRFDCPECVRRWEDTECRELRERLFPASTSEPAE
jgi:hypothetical protein